MEESGRMRKVKVWRSLEGTYMCGGENWEKGKKKIKYDKICGCECSNKG